MTRPVRFLGSKELAGTALALDTGRRISLKAGDFFAVATLDEETGSK
jgi:hypothetical protein